MKHHKIQIDNKRQFGLRTQFERCFKALLPGQTELSKPNHAVIDGLVENINECSNNLVECAEFAKKGPLKTRRKAKSYSDFFMGKITDEDEDQTANKTNKEKQMNGGKI